MSEKKQILFYTLLFVIFLYPFSITLSNEDGASANYLFILFPLLLGLHDKKFVKPKSFWLLSFVIFLLIFFLSIFYQYNLISFITRRVISFFLFMSIFTYMFIKIDKNMVTAFKYSLIVISFFFSIFTLYKFILLGASDLGFGAKGEVGSQRYGFVYVLALCILFFENKIFKPIKYFIIIIIGIGLLLTFSRSGLLAIMLTIFAITFSSIIKWFKIPSTKGLLIGLLLISFFILFLVLINKKYPIIFDFFYQRLFSYFDNNSSSQIDLDQDSSEGYRVYMLKKVINFTLFNPLTGSGYLGVWILFEDQSGSAHGQLVDVLFRTGFLGFIFYLIILYKLLFFYYKTYSGFFWGIFGVIIYGFFHETFKMTQVAFILAFFIGHASQHTKSCNYES